MDVLREPNTNPETLEVVLKYKALAHDKDAQEMLCQNPVCLPFLVYVLQDKRPEVVEESLQLLLKLSEEDKNCSAVSSTYGLKYSLRMLLKENCTSKIIRELALLLQSRLENFNKSDQTRILNKVNLQSSNGEGLRCNINKSNASRPSFLGPLNAKAKTLTFHLSGLYCKVDRKLCEEKLLQVKGVISITFNMTKQHCVTRVKADLNPRVILQSLSSIEGMYPKQVVKNELGEEILVGLNDCKEDLENLPEYLPELESPIKDNAVIKTKPANHSSGSWLSTAADFLSKFHW